MEKVVAARVGIDTIGRKIGAFHRNSLMLGRPLVAISHGRSSDLSSCRPSLPSQPIGPHCTVRAGCGRCQWHASIGMKSTEGGCVADNLLGLLSDDLQRPDRPGIAPEFPVALEALKLGGHHALFSMAITIEGHYVTSKGSIVNRRPKLPRGLRSLRGSVRTRREPHGKLAWRVVRFETIAPGIVAFLFVEPHRILPFGSWGDSSAQPSTVRRYS